jgi:biotin carboxyl carrier protein
VTQKKVKFRDREYIVELLPNGNIKVDDEIFDVDVTQGVNSIYKVDVDGHKFTIEVANEEFLIDGEKTNFKIKPYIPVISKKSIKTSRREIKISAPIPGKVTKIFVEVGQKISKDQELLILEAMKMRNRIFAPNDGEVKKILVKEDENVDQDQKLLIIQP